MSNKHPAGGKIIVQDNNIDKALRVLKKKLQRDGFFGEIRDRKFYKSKGQRKREDAAKSMRRQFRKEVSRTVKTLNVDKKTATKMVVKNGGRSPR